MARSVCHWRHEHLASYDRAWRSPAYARKVPAYAAMGHDAFKAMVNERAKRQLIRGVVKSALPRVDKVGLILAVDRLEHKDPATMRLKDDALRRLGVQAAPRPEAPIEAWRGRA